VKLEEICRSNKLYENYAERNKEVLRHESCGFSLMMNPALALKKKEQFVCTDNKQNPSHKKWETHLPRRDDGQRREPRIPHRVAWNENAATVDEVAGWGKQWRNGVTGKGAVREGGGE